MPFENILAAKLFLRKGKNLLKPATPFPVAPRPWLANGFQQATRNFSRPT
jgi:hypothetical protein